jgi:hypothetical protein
VERRTSPLSSQGSLDAAQAAEHQVKNQHMIAKDKPGHRKISAQNAHITDSCVALE